MKQAMTSPNPLRLETLTRRPLLVSVLCLLALAGVTLWHSVPRTARAAAQDATQAPSAGGDLDTAFNPNIVRSASSVFATTLQSDGKLLIGGTFNTVNGVIRNRVARLNSDGTLDTAFLNGQSGANGIVYALNVQPEGRIALAGLFNTVNGTARGNIARLNTDGTLDTGFLNGLSGTNGGAYSLALQTDGKIIIGAFSARSTMRAARV